VSRHAPKWSFPAAGSFQGVRTFREKRSQDGKRSQDRVLSNLAARVGLGQVPLGSPEHEPGACAEPPDQGSSLTGLPTEPGCARLAHSPYRRAALICCYCNICLRYSCRAGLPRLSESERDRSADVGLARRARRSGPGGWKALGRQPFYRSARRHRSRPGLNEPVGLRSRRHADR
jgi:hypothetical protein